MGQARALSRLLHSPLPRLLFLRRRASYTLSPRRLFHRCHPFSHLLTPSQFSSAAANAPAGLYVNNSTPLYALTHPPNVQRHDDRGRTEVVNKVPAVCVASKTGGGGARKGEGPVRRLIKEILVCRPAVSETARSTLRSPRRVIQIRNADNLCRTEVRQRNSGISDERLGTRYDVRGMIVPATIGMWVSENG